jgi:hypothetical protein
MRDSIHLQASSRPIFEAVFRELCDRWLKQEPYDRGEVHAQKTTSPEMVTRELRDVILDFKVPQQGAPGVTAEEQWAWMVSPNLPWAEDHFRERVSGMPLNPPPSERYWPFAQAGNAAHKKGEMFSHTYPERFWPRYAGDGGRIGTEKEELQEEPIRGIRFEYGDLRDLVDLMLKNPRTRQAYLPVWFPEDLAASVQGERVPCTLGYHFMLHPDGKIHQTYYMRSCDLLRFFRDDVYMAGRLLQWVVAEINTAMGPMNPEAGAEAEGYAKVGGIRMVISNLHAFEGDLETIREFAKPFNPRSGYNLDALS